MAEITVEGNQRTALGGANVEEFVVGATLKFLLADSRYVVPVFAQETDAGGADVFIDFDPHDSTGTGITRSRAASAP